MKMTIKQNNATLTLTSNCKPISEDNYCMNEDSGEFERYFISNGHKYFLSEFIRIGNPWASKDMFKDIKLSNDYQIIGYCASGYYIEKLIAVNDYDDMIVINYNVH